jgi:hypothetical protein
MMVLARSILFPIVAVVFLAVAFLGAAAPAQPGTFFPPLPAATAEGWRQYAELTQQRIDRELKAPKGFLASDFGPAESADRQAILAGKMPTASMSSRRADGREVDVPDGWVHHWRGAVLIPGVRLETVFQRLQAEVPGIGKGDVVAARITGRDGLHLRTFIKLQRSGRFILAYHFVYNTEHDVMFAQSTPTRATSRSTATKIAEMYLPGSAQERELRPGEDNRLLQRWNSYWRYEEVSAGVIAECESITLSRNAPWGFGWTRSLVDSTARESMEKALVNLRGHFKIAGRTTPASSPAR